MNTRTHMKAFIASTMEHMWRCNAAFSVSSTGWVKCWHVFDSDGQIIAGGYRSGNNQKSGHPQFSRKRDAEAWLAGYEGIFTDWEAYRVSRGYDKHSCCHDDAKRSFENGEYNRKSGTHSVWGKSQIKHPCKRR